MNSRDVLAGLFLCASTSAFAQLPPGVNMGPGGQIIVTPAAGPNVNLPAGTQFNSVVAPPGVGVSVGGVAIQAGSVSATPVIRPDATPAEIKTDFPMRSRGGLGGLPPMNVRIQGDGIGLPKGVGDSNKAKADEKKEQAEGKKDTDQEKGKGQGDAKPGGVATVSPQGEGKPKEASPEDKKNPPLEPARGITQPPLAAGGKPVTGGPREEKEQDPVARRIDQGLERNPGTVQPGDVKVRETGVSVPRCFGESREGENC